MEKKYMKLYLGLVIAFVGLVSMFFVSTRSIGPFIIGFGLTFALLNASGDKNE